MSLGNRPSLFYPLVSKRISDSRKPSRSRRGADWIAGSDLDPANIGAGHRDCRSALAGAGCGLGGKSRDRKHPT